MPYTETPLTFECRGDALVGILTQPENPATLGVLIIVGGPQCRTGSHRQFTLLARGLARHNIPSLRFDYRGMGDSTGDLRNFEEIQEDVSAAFQAFRTHSPATRRIVLWGLCDAASAAIFHTRLNPEVAGLILCNPWTRTEQSLAKAQIKHYYRSRLTDRQLWKKILSGQFRLTQSLRELCTAALKMARPSPPRDTLPPPVGKNAARLDRLCGTDPAHSQRPGPDGPGIRGDCQGLRSLENLAFIPGRHPS